ncbi:MAG: PIG-L family deacetylase [Myxococcales bacterium]|nr:PIG-L family deacetylase [Myxococcales bacterium]
MRATLLAWLVVAGCGDNLTPVGPAMEPASTLFLVAHPDDEMIFMQPQLLDALHAGSVTTVYATTAGPDGVDHHLFEAAKTAYGAIVGSSAWDCGSLDLEVAVVEHCRLSDRPVSLINLDLADGGLPGDRRDSLLHLVDGTVASLPVHGPRGGRIDLEGVIELFSRLLEATAPRALHTLELAGTHGRDHSSHMFVASFALWAAARVRFAGEIAWHRGYNVDVEAPTLAGDALAAAATMLGYYEACADGCGTCGASCPTLIPAHETWLGRQYGVTRVREAGGPLSSGDRCLDASLALGDCASAPGRAARGDGRAAGR